MPNSSDLNDESSHGEVNQAPATKNAVEDDEQSDSDDEEEQINDTSNSSTDMQTAASEVIFEACRE